MGFDAHMTLLFTGDLTKTKEYFIRGYLEKFDRHDAVYEVERKCISMFGEGNIPVVEIIPTNFLSGLRLHMIESKFPNPSEFGFNPHITLKLDHDEDIHIPRIIELTHLDLY